MDISERVIVSTIRGTGHQKQCVINIRKIAYLLIPSSNNNKTLFGSKFTMEMMSEPRDRRRKIGLSISRNKPYHKEKD